MMPPDLEVLGVEAPRYKALAQLVPSRWLWVYSLIEAHTWLMV